MVELDGVPEAVLQKKILVMSNPEIVEIPRSRELNPDADNVDPYDIESK